MYSALKIVATTSTPDEKIIHAANILAEYLDNNEDGIPENSLVVTELVEKEATLVMALNENELEANSDSLPDSDAIQDLYASEVFINSDTEFDASLEEVLHLITHVGYAGVYPGVFGENIGTAVADAMDSARGGRFNSVPSSYPAGAWYTYDDITCDYGCMVTEYIYWALTSLLGAQDFPGRLDEINNEWQLNTRSLVENRDNAIFTVLTDEQYGLASQLPDGQYSHSTFVVEQQ